MARKSNKFKLSEYTEVDVVAILGKRIRITSMPIHEAQAMKKKPSTWRIELYQQGFHAFKATE